MINNRRRAGSIDITRRKAALVAGIGLLIMSVLAPFAEFNVMQKILVPADAAKTVAIVSAFGWKFPAAIGSFVIIIVCDIIVAWALYIFLKGVNKDISLLAAWFRLVYAAIFAVALSRCVETLWLVGGSSGFAGEGLNNQVMLSLKAFRSGWDVGLVFFGIHLLILGYLVFKSGYVPGWLGVLLSIAGLGYLIDSIGKALITDYSLAISVFTFAGEPLFMIWLLWKGIRGFRIPVPQES